jgi:hypothetical protein
LRHGRDGHGGLTEHRTNDNDLPEDVRPQMHPQVRPSAGKLD